MESNKIRMFVNSESKQMSAEESQLPEVLQKLEIVPISHASKISVEPLPIVQNPFFELDEAESKGTAVNQSCDPEKLFGPKCQCSAPIASDSPSAAGASSNGNNLEHTILNQTQFKHRHITNKFQLKVPVLKVLRTCIHHNHVKHKLTPYARRQSRSTNAIDDLSECPSLETLTIKENQNAVSCSSGGGNNNKSPGSFASTKPNPLDFKALVQECDSISSTVSSSLSQLAGDKDIKHRKHGKQFTTIQSIDLRKGKESRKHKKGHQLKVSTQSNCRQGASSSNSGSSSCSQQARINASTATACDVTIDELASYFETFVHIPKKMSSMAEMMYI